MGLYWEPCPGGARLLRLLERKLEGSDTYTICGSGSDSSAEIHIKREGGELA